MPACEGTLHHKAASPGEFFANNSSSVCIQQLPVRCMTEQLFLKFAWNQVLTVLIQLF
jgi:hypothetical protein